MDKDTPMGYEEIWHDSLEVPPQRANEVNDLPGHAAYQHAQFMCMLAHRAQQATCWLGK